MTYYKAWRMPGIGEKPKWVIVDEAGKVVDRNPSKNELKGLEKEPYKHGNSKPRPWMCYTDEELLNGLRRFEKEYGMLPTMEDFTNNLEYPSGEICRIRFGSWNKALEKAFGIKRDKNNVYTDEELLNELRRFEKYNRRPPTTEDFNNNSEYPSFRTYQNRFGSWIGALIKAGLDVDLIGKQCDKYRGRQIEIDILNYIGDKVIDLSGEDSNSYCDGICPGDGPYDVKSSRFHSYSTYGGYWAFGTTNHDKDDDREAIQWYYFLAFNNDYTELKYAWRVPGEMVEGNTFYVILNVGKGKFSVENMKEYDITSKVKDTLKRRRMTKSRKQDMEDLEKMIF